MLMTVLKGDLAVKQSKDFVRTFKRMKDYILDNESASCVTLKILAKKVVDK